MKLRLNHINTALLIAIVIINGYILVMPALPSFLFWIRQDEAAVSALQKRVDANPHVGRPDAATQQPNSLVIPRLQLDEQVLAGQSAAVLKQGLWLRPQGSKPYEGGNTVIAGHRFTYTDPQGSFYHLDKMQLGDRIALFWEGKRYVYRVTEMKTVKANQIEIEQATDTARLTLYTCTPLWLPKDRLVVVAEGISE
jgi:LPXTG-site transpeptidase (sortase) family protein